MQWRVKLKDMNSKERFEFLKKAVGDEHYKSSAEDVVQNLVNDLINALYIPVKGWDGITKADHNRIKHFGINDGEPINWGDLKCNEVKKFDDGSFLVIIDEAAPKNCQTFCEYIETYMRSYGWDVTAETEW